MPAPAGAFPVITLLLSCWIKSTALNVRVVPEQLIRKAKSEAALQGKTLRQWIIEAIQEKLKRSR